MCGETVKQPLGFTHLEFMPCFGIQEEYCENEKHARSHRLPEAQQQVVFVFGTQHWHTNGIKGYPQSVFLQVIAKTDFHPV